MIILEDDHDKTTDKAVLESAFNGAVQTLSRIDELIRHISSYNVNDELKGVYENLSELYIESQGFLSKPELKTLKNKWDNVNIYWKKTTIKEEEYIYSSELKRVLWSFSAWIRLKLHRHKVTMAGKKEIADALSNLYKKYNI